MILLLTAGAKLNRALRDFDEHEVERNVMS